MALSFHPTAAPLFHLDAAERDMSPEVTDALLGFVCDPAVDAGLDDFLGPLPTDDDDDRRCAKRPRAAACCDGPWPGFSAADGLPWSNQPLLSEFLTEFVLPLPPPPQTAPPAAFVRGADASRAAAGCGPSVQSAAARERRKRISQKTAELARLVPGGHKLNTAEMLQEAGRHLKLLQAQVGMLALMHSVQREEMPSMAQEQMRALLVSGGVQERLAAEGRCLVPRELVDAMGKDSTIKSNATVKRDLGRFIESLEQKSSS